MFNHHSNIPTFRIQHTDKNKTLDTFTLLIGGFSGGAPGVRPP